MLVHPFAAIEQSAGGRPARRGGLLAALVIALPLLGGLGYGADAARGVIVQARLSRAVDQAALAGGRVFFDTQRDRHIRTFFENTFPNGFLGAETEGLAISSDPGEGTLTVVARASMEGVFFRILGIDERLIEARAKVRRPSRSGG